MKNKSVRLFSDKFLENIGSVFTSLYKNELLTDLTLFCKDGSIKVHKLVLAARSSFFKQVFTNQPDLSGVFYMYGISLWQLKHLLELIYKGSISLNPDIFNSVYELAEELQIGGLLVDELNDSTTSTPAPFLHHGDYSRDTRFKGTKRVAVDFNGDDTGAVPGYVPNNPSLVPNIKKEFPDEQSQAGGESLSDSSDERTIMDKDGLPSTDTSMDESTTDEKHILSSWERKERKFKCELCPSSFKRASHLSRHQLVHTGERPYACDQCDKAFSRHDKLKHHISKAHEMDSNEPLPADALYTIGHVQFLTPEQTMYESPGTINTFGPYEDPESGRQKKRGRPRKHPIVPPPLVKRPRGRPRIKPITPVPEVKRPRGRPRINPIGPSTSNQSYQTPARTEYNALPPTSHPQHQQQQQPPPEQQHQQSTVGAPPQALPAPTSEKYDITTMPYGDLKYLTKPLHVIDLEDDEDDEDNEENGQSDQATIMEPLIQIDIEPSPSSNPPPPPQATTSTSATSTSTTAQAPPSTPLSTSSKTTNNDALMVANNSAADDPQQSFMQNIGLLENTIGKIGECTISVASTEN